MIKGYKLLALAVLSVTLSVPADDFNQNNNQQEAQYSQSQYLGVSSNPNPSNLGAIPQTVNNYPTAPTINANWSTQQYNQMQNINQYDAANNSFINTPAWAQKGYYDNKNYNLMPFGASLFKGHFAKTYSDNLNANYRIVPGDRVLIRIWGAKKYDDVLIVDQQGNIFVPEVGPIMVAGVTHSQLLSTVKSKISQIFTNNVEVYINLQSSQPVGVFVTGFVNNPGQYAGGTYVSIIFFIDRAGGINYDRGSFRQIVVKRNNKAIAKLDLYDFILSGTINNLRLQDGDVILVEQKQSAVSVYGLVKQEAIYELKQGDTGNKLAYMVSPSNKVSHVSVSGTRDNRPFHKYLTIKDFNNFKLVDGDRVDFVADVKGDTIMALASGAIKGASRYPIQNTTRLRDLLAYIEVENELANTQAIYIKRKSVALQQKVAIEDALRRLEQSALTATSSSVDEAKIRVDEATLIQDFVKRAGMIEPDGIVVVSRGGVVNNIRLEDGDEIIIPQLSDVVQVSGEVMMPKAVTYDESMSLDDYLAAAGGVSNRADDKYILVAKANGEVGLADNLGIEAGDQILVMPRFDSKNMQLAKDVMQILYQMAVATKVVVDL